MSQCRNVCVCLQVTWCSFCSLIVTVLILFCLSHQLGTFHLLTPTFIIMSTELASDSQPLSPYYNKPALRGALDQILGAVHESLRQGDMSVHMADVQPQFVSNVRIQTLLMISLVLCSDGSLSINNATFTGPSLVKINIASSGTSCMNGTNMRQPRNAPRLNSWTGKGP